MAKNFPFFKFIPTEWMTGDIVYEDFSVQGLFVNLCALYWQRDGKLTVEDINKRYKNPVELAELTDRFLKVNDGFISIKFLDEQLVEANHISKVNSANGALGGRPRLTDRLPTALPSDSESKAEISKEEQEEELEQEKDFLGTDKPPTTKKGSLAEKVEMCDKRELQFYDTLKPFVSSYQPAMIRKFYDHWRERNKSRTRMKFELEETWDVNLRLIRWETNNQKFNKEVKPGIANDDTYKTDRAKAEARTLELASR